MSPHPLWRRVAGVVGRGFALLLVVLLTGWAMAALYFDLLSGSSLRHVTVSGYGIAMLGTLLAFRGRDKGIAICIAAFVLVLAWWLTLKPSNDRAWQPDVATLPYAEILGDRVTVHNVRNADYRSETDYTIRLEDRELDLSRLRSLDLFLVYWGSPLIAHTIMSWGFEGDQYLVNGHSIVLLASASGTWNIPPLIGVPRGAVVIERT